MEGAPAGSTRSAGRRFRSTNRSPYATAVLAAKTIARRVRSAARGSSGPAAAGQGFAGTASSERPRTVSAPPPGPEEQLVAKLRRIEALHARPGSEGERLAAERARQRI
ncbi:MAG: hypothetical protein ACK52U_10620, partial [Synechococcaceae cyanobacterium]